MTSSGKKIRLELKGKTEGHLQYSGWIEIDNIGRITNSSITVDNLMAEEIWLKETERHNK